METNHRIVSGIRPTGYRLHLGNYEGAVKPLVELQRNRQEVYCMIADYHALTTQPEKGYEIACNRYEIAKDLIACGLNPIHTAIFYQSNVHQHAQLHVLLSMMTPLGMLERIPTYKEKRDEANSQVSYGLLGYPVLQAADILLYRPRAVPVGYDQLPHVELANDIGAKFNRMYGDIFPHFEYLTPEEGARKRVPGLDMRKMSKSYDNCIYLSDEPDEIRAKVYQAYTTPTKIKLTDAGVPDGCAVCQLLKIYSPNHEIQLEEDRLGIRGCVKNKSELTEALVEYLRPIRERRAKLTDEQVGEALMLGHDFAQSTASQTMYEVRKAMNFTGYRPGVV